MARYYRRRYRTIVRAPKKKWASNIKQIQVTTTGDATAQYGTLTLVTNSPQAASPTPVIVKTGNFKIQGDYYVTTNLTARTASVSLYVVFLPQGLVIASTLEAKAFVASHPEWILAWKYLGSNPNSSTLQSFDGFTFSSRLKRNLNSGDSILLICIAEGTALSAVDVEGMAQYWTCAN